MKLNTLLRTPALLLGLLGVGLVALWVRSFWRADILACFWAIPDDPIAKRSPYTSKFFNVSTGGVICLFVSRTRVTSSTNPPRPVIYGHESVPGPAYPFVTPRPGVGATHRIIGFGFTHVVNKQISLEQTYSAVTVPIPALILTAAPLPTWWVRARRREHRRSIRAAASQCIHGGYDLRASKDRCPECGEPISCESA